MKTKQLLSLILAVLMVASLIPAAVIGAFAEDATQETFGRVTYETVQIYGGPTSPSVGGWATYNTDLTALNASGRNAADADGILIDVAWNKAGLSKAQIKLKLDDENGSLKALGGTDGAYYGNDNYTSGSSATGNWLEVPTAAWEGTIFLSKATLDTWSKSDFSVFRFALSAGQAADNLHASFSNVRLAYKVAEIEEPETLMTMPSGEALKVTSFNTAIGKPSWSQNTWATTNWKASMELEQSEGILFKIDTSAATDTSKPLQMSFAMTLFDTTGNTTDYMDKGNGKDESVSADGGGAYILANAGAADYFGESSTREGATSTWYFLEDGATEWQSFENAPGEPLMQMDIGATTGYVYVPLDSMYHRFGESQLKGLTADKTEPFATAVRALEIRRGGSINHFHTYFGVKADGSGLMNVPADTEAGSPSAAASISEISIVHKDDITYTYDVSTPDNFPGVTDAAGFNRYSLTKSTENALATELSAGVAVDKNNTNQAAIAEGFASAAGVLVAIDTSKTFTEDYNAQLSFQLRMQVYAKNKDGQSITLQIVNSPYYAKSYASQQGWSTTVPAGTNSIGYATVNGEAWHPDYGYTHGVSGYHSTSRVHGKSYFYIPADQWYIANDPSTISSAYEGRTDALSMAELQELAKTEGGSWAFTGFYSVQTYCMDYKKFGGSTSPFESVELIVPTYEDYGTQPNTLPDGSAYMDSALFNNFTWTYERNVTDTWQNFNSRLNMSPEMTAQGVMFKIDTTNAATGGDDVGLMFRMVADYKVSDLGVKTNGNVSATYITANPKLADVDATAYWYVSRDGKTWTTIEHTPSHGSYCPVTSGREALYVYIPFTSMWVGTTNDNVIGSGENGGTTSVADIIAKTGGFNVTGWRLYLNPNPGNAENPGDASTNYRTAAKNTIMSDFSLVHAYDGTTDLNVSVSVTDTLAMNVYADLPYGSNPVFTVNGEEIKAVVDAATGISRYQLDNILPYQITNELAYSMTFTLPGAAEATTIAGTTSIYKYLKDVIAAEEISDDWKNLAQATINYAAAAQDYAGELFEGTKIDAADVKELANPVTDYTALNGSSTNERALGADSKLNATELDLTEAIKIKITDTVAEVQYSINDRTGTATVENGFVYIPVYATEMGATVIITDAGNASDTLKVSLNWYIANAASSDDALTALINAIANYGQAAAAVAENI